MDSISEFDPSFAARLAEAGLRGFDDFWNLEWTWVEPRNERRNGWSGATRISVETASGPLSLFVKRQEDHCYRSLRHPLRGRPTFYREWRNIRRLRDAGVPTLDPVFYGERMKGGRYQAVLVTLALDDFRELDEVFGEELPETQRRLALNVVAQLLARFHQKQLRHNCLSGNHLLLRFDAAGAAEARLLDLEKMKRTHNSARAAARDLSRFIRHTPTMSREDHVELLRRYGGIVGARRLKRLMSHLNAALRGKGRKAKSPITLTMKS
jgi:hypothetical protein